MSLTFVQQSQRTKGPPNQATIQKMLDENNQLIQAIIEYQNKGTPSEMMQYQHMLHRNLVYLATIADSNQNTQALLPALGPGQANPNQMAGSTLGGHGGQMAGQMNQLPMGRPAGQMMGPRPNMPGQMVGPQMQQGQVQPTHSTGQGMTALSKLMQLRPQVAMGDRNTPSPGGQNTGQRPPMSTASGNASSMPMSGASQQPQQQQQQQPMSNQQQYFGQPQQMMMQPGQMGPNQGNVSSPSNGPNLPMAQNSQQMGPQQQQPQQHQPMSQSQQPPMSQAQMTTGPANASPQPLSQHQGIPAQQQQQQQQQPMMPQQGGNQGNQVVGQMLGGQKQMLPPPHPPGSAYRRSPNQGQQYGQPGHNQSQQPPAQTQGSFPQNGPQYSSQTFTGQNQGQGVHPQQSGPQGQGYNGMQGPMPQQGPPGQYSNPTNFPIGQQGANQASPAPNQMGYNMYGQRSPMPGGPGSQVRPQMVGPNMVQGPSGNGQMQGPINNQMSSGQPGGQPSGQGGFGGYNQNQF